MKTQVGIVGAGPSGLLLAQMLHLAGIESVILESRSRAYIENRQRAGVLEHGVVQTLRDCGVGHRLAREGMVHEGIDIRFGEKRHRLDVKALSGGQCVTVYPQHEIVKDLVEARLRTGHPILFGAKATSLLALDQPRPRVRYEHEGEACELECDFVAGCDGFHGISRAAVPAGQLEIYGRDYPFAWLGILAEAPPASHEVIYAHHERGFALQSMRSPSVSRLYLQCAIDEDVDQWSDDRIWSELHARFATDDGFLLNEGRIVQKSLTPMRSFVTAPMRHGRLMLAGDAAHIVPPTGAKGLNSAVGDVRIMAAGLDAYYRRGQSDLLDRYSDIALHRVWKTQRFAASLCTLLHRFHDEPRFQLQMQLAELRQIVEDARAAELFARNYTGLPFDV
ncbi:4-hydroxybenzoate 3-monooxygenase [Pigmentiphaga sp. NML080357]|nr:4-hydroxybenzoate 3-monooxygenase [Pigmentiphaga sp. NML080357]